MLTVGKRIRYFRKLRGITQDELANLSGIHPVSIRKYETNKMVPQPAQITRIAAALNVNFSALNGSSQLAFRLETVGDLLGLIILLHKCEILVMKGERGEDHLLKEETIRFYPNENLVRFFDFPCEQGQTSGLHLRFDRIGQDLTTRLLHWEAEYDLYNEKFSNYFETTDPKLQEEYDLETTKIDELELGLQESRRWLDEEPGGVTLDDLLCGDDPRFDLLKGNID